MKNLKPILILLSFFAILVLFTSGVSAANWTVNPGDNIQSAINNASENDTVTINDNNGTDYIYNENVVINKKLQLQTNNGGRVTINALDSSKPVFTINSPGNGSSIIGFIITGSTGSHGIYVNTNNCQIIGNTISNNGGYGVNVAGTNVTVINNIVFNNGNAGLVVNGVNASVKWNNVTFNGNRGFNGWSWDGISVTGANGTVIGNNVTGNSRSGISVNGANALVFLNYLVQNGGYGIGVTGANATVINNTVVDNGNAGIVITSGDNSTVSNNTVTNNGNRGFNGW
ncbi:MAG: right-handed parallel beta-helix repeat-containing protein, partial [Methanobacteriaceae archaeon]|nr:right-handed parallel beta-helix repeat-containing protein [Methanobacteriaceae archaeon]